jgi:LmbE family N-acetylglucosaminyl deacetylase
MPVVLALCAHPDDAEFRCGGTLLLLAHRGWEVHIATVCTGNCGSAELSPNATATLRRGEARSAAAMAGGTYHCLDGLDLQVYDNDEFRGKATALIRAIDPDCIITHYPTDYMPDHDAASAIARCAAFTASMPNYVVGPASALKPTDRVAPLYYFGPLGGTDFFGAPVVAPWFVEVTAVIEEKAEMLAQHVSQREWLRRQHGMDQYIEEMKHWDRDAGTCCATDYAEGFFQHRGHGYPQTPVLQAALKELVREPVG